VVNEHVQQLLRSALEFLSLPSAESASGVKIQTQTVLVLDTSTSMHRHGYDASRLAAAKEAALAFIRNRSASGLKGKIAVVAFATGALTVCPLTDVKGRKKLESTIRSIQADGDTNIAAGLIMAEQLFADSEDSESEREVVLLSDGANNSRENPVHAANRLKCSGCRIHTIGIGTGAEVDENLLRELASTGQDGRRLYEFIGDKGGLIKHFESIGGLTR